jgi:hypothetical protein
VKKEHKLRLQQKAYGMTWQVFCLVEARRYYESTSSIFF